MLFRVTLVNQHTHTFWPVTQYELKHLLLKLLQSESYQFWASWSEAWHCGRVIREHVGRSTILPAADRPNNTTAIHIGYNTVWSELCESIWANSLQSRTSTDIQVRSGHQQHMYVTVLVRCVADQLFAHNRDRDDRAISRMLCTGA